MPHEGEQKTHEGCACRKHGESDSYKVSTVLGIRCLSSSHTSAAIVSSTTAPPQDDFSQATAHHLALKAARKFSFNLAKSAASQEESRRHVVILLKWIFDAEEMAMFDALSCAHSLHPSLARMPRGEDVFRCLPLLRW